MDVVVSYLQRKLGEKESRSVICYLSAVMMLSIVTLLNYFYYNALSPLLSILATEYGFSEEQRDYMLGLFPYTCLIPRQSLEQYLFHYRLSLFPYFFLHCRFAEQKAHLHWDFSRLPHLILSPSILFILHSTLLLEGVVGCVDYVHNAHLPIHSRRHLSEQSAFYCIRDLISGRWMRHATWPNY